MVTVTDEQRKQIFSDNMAKARAAKGRPRKGFATRVVLTQEQYQSLSVAASKAGHTTPSGVKRYIKARIQSALSE